MSGRRLNFILAFVVVLLAAGLVLQWQGRRPAVPLPPPGDGTEGDDEPRFPSVARGQHSVLLITCDTTRADHLEPYGAANIDTPTFKRLAAEGILYENAFSVAPITLVAHTSILTGLYPPQHGVRNNGLHRAAPELTTLAERLRARGYRTAAFVSAAVLDRQYGLDQGFELYDDDLSSGRERHPRMVPDRPAEATVTAASAWLDQLGADEKFFVWVHFYDPHAAYSPPPPYRDTYRDRLYDGEIAYMDAQLGRLLAHPRLHSLNDVVVSVLADHGESLGEHGEQTHAVLAYDSTLHIPWLLHVPGGPRGLRVRVGVSQIDVVPSILNLLALPADPTLPGRSVIPPFEDRREIWQRPLYSETYLPFYTYGWAKLRVVREGSWKFVDAPTAELYDLRRDPRELSNQAEHAPGESHDLQRDLHDLMARFGDPEYETVASVDSAVQEQLRNLGYQVVGSGSAHADSGPRPDPKQFIGLHVSLEVARSFSERKLYDEAIRQLQSVLQRDPTNLAALIDLAQAYADNGQVEEALQTTHRALGLDPDLPRLYLLMAGLEDRRGHLEQGLQLIDLALQRDPDNLEAIIQQAVQLRQLRRDDEAEQVLRAALAHNPEHPRLNAIYAQIVELRKGELDAAEARLRQALARDPFLLLAWRVLGDVLERSGHLEDAMSAYREGLKRRPDDADFHARLGLLLARQGSDPSAEMHLRESLRLSRQFRAGLQVSLGAWLAENGRWEEAQEEYAKVLTRQPRNPGARNNRAIAYYHVGRVAEAETEFKALVADSPDLPDPYSNLAAIALDREQWSEAEGWAHQALQRNARMVEAWNNLGIALNAQGKRDEAVQSFRQALEIEPKYWQARNNIAMALREQGQAKEAAAVFLEVLRQVPDHPEVHYELGNLYAGPLHDPERARAHYNAFLQGAPSDPRADEVRAQLAHLPVTAAEEG